MEFKNKASLIKNKFIKSIIIIGFLGIIGCAALILAIYSIINRQPVFSAAYFVACFLSVIYTAIKINTVLPVFIANDVESIHLRRWENCFFPFKINKGFFGEFIPEPVENEKFPIEGIKSVYIGSGNFISRAIPESEFAKTFQSYKKKYTSSLRRVEFIHITLPDGSEKYMPVTDFDPEAMAKIVNDIKKSSKNMFFTTSNRHIRRFVTKTDINLTDIR